MFVDLISFGAKFWVSKVLEIFVQHCVKCFISSFRTSCKDHGKPYYGSFEKKSSIKFFNICMQIYGTQELQYFSLAPCLGLYMLLVCVL